MRLPKDIKYGDEARQKMLKGIKALTDAVKVTLGPKGRNVGIYNRNRPLRVTKDGVSVAKEVILKDDFENFGAQILKEVAIKTCAVAGDGTTTATVLACAMIESGIEALKNGASPVVLKKQIDSTVEWIVVGLKDRSKQITTYEETVQVATISANGETAIGELIAEAFEKVSKDGVVTIEETKASKTHLEVVEGLQFNSGYISPYFANNIEKMVCELENPFVLIYDSKFSAFKQLEAVCQFIGQNNHSLLIVCDDIELEALKTLVINKERHGFKWCAVKCPGMDEGRMDLLQDLNVLTGAHVFASHTGDQPSNFKPHQLGRAAKVIVSFDNTIVIHDKNNKDKLDAHLTYLRDLLDNSKDEQRKNYVHSRIGKLTNGIAVIRVGGSTELEMKERKDRIEDAMHATRAALQEGILPGGGVPLFSIGMSFSEDLVCSSVCKPFLQILVNAGLDAEAIGKQVYDQHAAGDLTCGYDAKNECFVDMFEAGIIDPTKVVRTALEDAASVAGLFLLTEVVMLEEQEYVVNGLHDANQTFRIKSS